MLELFRALVFGQVITLSPGLADLGDIAVRFVAAKPIEALNAGARLSVNVSSVVAVSDSLDTMRRTEEVFPKGCIQATGIQPNGNEIQLKSQTVAWSSTGAYVVLAQEGGANTSVEFTAINVTSCRPVPKASAEWANYGK